MLHKSLFPLQNVTTYQAGLLQVRANRNMNEFLSLKLKAYNLTLPEWAFLGILLDKQTQHLSDISEALDVERPFVTRLANGLVSKKLIEKKKDSADARAVCVALTVSGTELVKGAESDLRKALKIYLKDISTDEMVSYMSILEKIAKLNATST